MAGAGQAKYRPYPVYRPSGVEWLGEIPEGWEVKKLKYVCTHNDDVLSETVPKDWELEYVDIGSVSAEEGIKGTQTMPFQKAPSRARRIVRNGDILISTVRTYLKAIAPIIDPPENMVASTGFAVIRPILEFQSEFASFALRLEGYINEIVARSVGVSYPAINASDLVDICVPLPPLPEQTKIAAFLDHETAKIDGLIAKQQRLIALLEEKRQAVISHAVTKGLDPTVPLRPSGIDWLGDVPAHWEVKRLKYLCQVSTGSRNTEDAKEDGVFPFFVRSQTVERINSGPYNCEAILTAGDGVGVGKVYHYIDGQFDCHQRVYMLTDFEELSGKFIFEYLENNFFNVALAGQAKSTVDSLRMPVFLNFEVTVPPNHEQNAIVAHVARKKNTFAKLSKRAQSAIDLLKERRTALISAAVTGKIDLRDWQSPDATSDISKQDINQNEEALA